MHFDAYSIARKRYRMRRTLRFIALILVTLAVWYTTFWVCQLVISSLSATIGWISVFPIAPAGSFVITAGVLMLFERKLSSWIVPPAPKGCPNCGYAIDTAKAATCPECGTSLLSAPSGTAPQRP